MTGFTIQGASAPRRVPVTGTGVREQPPFTVGQRVYLRVKRLLEAGVAALALLLLAPLLVAIGLAVLICLGRPAVFVQERVTLHGKKFRLRKFRTMLTVDPRQGRYSDAERMTRFGTWLRSSSLDELPSLWNIVTGDMSIIGPRPLVPAYMPLYSPEQRRRYWVRAGLTGLAQVSGRNSVPWDVRLGFDHRYVLLFGPLIDLQILVRTVGTVLRRDGINEVDEATTSDFPGPLNTARIRFDVNETENSWTATTSAGEPIAQCALHAHSRHCALLSVRPARAPASTTPLEDAAVETVTLLINRARARGFIHACAHASPQTAHLFELHGFVVAPGGCGSAPESDAGPRLTAPIRITA